jgi:hypothetical protein
MAVFAGNGSYHHYLAAYRFVSRSSLKIAVAAGAPIDVHVRVGDGGGDLGIPISDSLQMDFVVRTPDAPPRR